jgi:hypothetical protein
VNTPSQPVAVEEIAKALRAVVTVGLPLRGDYADERLLRLPCVLERCVDPDDRVQLVAVLEVVLKESLTDYSDDARRDALRALFGVAPGARKKKVDDRRRSAASALNRDAEHFRKRIEPKLLDMLAMLLYQRSVRVLPSPLSTAVLASKTVSYMRQLYRYAQEALLYVETFDVMSEIVGDLRDADAGQIYRMAFANISIESHFTDRALWAFSYAHSAFVSTVRDPEGARFLREALPPMWWDAKLDRPFHWHSAEALDSVLSDAYDADELGRRLRSTEDGAKLESYWRRLLSNPDFTADPIDTHPYAVERESLRVQLVVLCQLLRGFFPEETRPPEEMQDAYQSIIFNMLILVGQYATDRSIPDHTRSVEKGIARAMRNIPAHYVFGDEEDCLLAQ